MKKFPSQYTGLGLPRWLSGKASACSERDAGSNPGLRRFPGEGNGNPLQYSCRKSHRQRSRAGCSPWNRKRVGHNLTKQQYRAHANNNIIFNNGVHIIYLTISSNLYLDSFQFSIVTIFQWTTNISLFIFFCSI